MVSSVLSRRRRSGPPDRFGRVLLVGLLLVAGAAVVLGESPSATVVELRFGSVWLANEADAELARVSGPAARVDRRITLPAAPGDRLQVVTLGSDVLVLAAAVGTLVRIDTVAVRPVARAVLRPGRLTLHAGGEGDDGDEAVVAVVDADRGRVLHLHPRSLQVIGRQRVPTGPSTAALDGTGVLWLAPVGDGEVLGLRPGGPPHRVAVAPPTGRLDLVAGGPTVHALDRRDGRWSALPTGPATALPDWPGPDAHVGASPHGEAVVAHGDRLRVHQVAVGRTRAVTMGAPATGPPVATGGSVHVPLGSALAVLDRSAGTVHRVGLPGLTGPFDVTVSDGYAFARPPGGDEVWVVDPDGVVDRVRLDDPAARRLDGRGRVVDDLPDDLAALDGPWPVPGSGPGAPSGARQGVVVVDPCAGPTPADDCDPPDVRCDYGGTAPACVTCANGGGAVGADDCPTICDHGGLPAPPTTCVPCPEPPGGTAVDPGACPVLVGCDHGGSAVVCVPCPEPPGGTAVDPGACPQPCGDGGWTTGGPCVPCPDGSDAATPAGCPGACDHGGAPPLDSTCVPCPDGSDAARQADCPPAATDRARR